MRAMAAHTRHAAANLGLVHKILDVEPPPVVSSASRGQLQVGWPEHWSPWMGAVGAHAGVQHLVCQLWGLGASVHTCLRRAHPMATVSCADVRAACGAAPQHQLTHGCQRCTSLHGRHVSHRPRHARHQPDACKPGSQHVLPPLRTPNPGRHCVTERLRAQHPGHAQLTRLLRLPPTEGVCHAQPSVGTHRMAAAEVVALVMAARNRGANERIVELGLLPRLVRLCLDRPHCSPLQVQCLSIIACAPCPWQLPAAPAVPSPAGTACCELGAGSST